MPRVVITPRSYGMYSPDIWDRWEKAGVEVHYEPGPLPEERLSELLRDVEALLVGTDTVTGRVLAGSRVKVIVKYGVGLDNIDADYAGRNGIRVFNTPGVNTEAVADYTFGLILALARNIPGSHAALMRGQWKKTTGLEIWGKTIGILGTGAIGKAVARRAKGFSMRILAWDKYPDPAAAKELGYEYADLESVLRRSDVISLHVALNAETKHLIGRRELAWMKPDALLVNTARGGIVEEEALFLMLAERRIAGAALDVFGQEPPVLPDWVRSLDNLIVTPHNAASSVEAIIRMTEQSTERILAFLAGSDGR